MTNSLNNVVKISELGAATQCGSHVFVFFDYSCRTVFVVEIYQCFKFFYVIRCFVTTFSYFCSCVCL